ncbi:hypothetical protein CISG_00265 [Coccidioides immitis RMSCC 3703]|uniref:Uncharacterized protein n=2 Tax=Coccidioides immitis TaxID=5501 RepID=A0A0J8QHK0_COCIT|nr:hypothetical protein CIRG_07272 [Coccidioides immitis RMSCC 2394]KMU71956.1 hypothetical protein CISG_00265 [Coccidioides immitis RMSCC 3703]
MKLAHISGNELWPHANRARLAVSSKRGHPSFRFIIVIASSPAPRACVFAVAAMATERSNYRTNWFYAGKHPWRCDTSAYFEAHVRLTSLAHYSVQLDAAVAATITRVFCWLRNFEATGQTLSFTQGAGSQPEGGRSDRRSGFYSIDREQ